MAENVPFISQYDESVALEWRPRVCALACAAMALKFYAQKGESDAVALPELLEEGLFIRGHEPPAGWSHLKIAALLRNHGLRARLEEFRSHVIDAGKHESAPSRHEAVLADAGIDAMKRHLAGGGLVIVSLANGSASGSHLVLLTGFEEEGEGSARFILNDPEAKEASAGKGKGVGISEFLLRWRKMAIFLGPKSMPQS